jgi:hypothetical protein
MMNTATVSTGSTLRNMSATPRDLAVNGLVLGFAGAMWLGWAQEGPPAGWSVPLSIGSVVGVLVAVLAGVLTWRSRHGASAMADERGRRTYYRVVGVEVAAIAVGATALGISGQSEYIAAWILFVVGVHFVPLGRLFHIGSLKVVGVLAAVVSVVAVATGLLWTVLPSAVAGGVGGLLLVVFGAWSLLRVVR